MSNVKGAVVKPSQALDLGIQLNPLSLHFQYFL